jgi:hypothetical protein
MDNTEPLAMTEIVDRVRSGARLVVVDDRVLDIAGFLDRHPGGAAVLRTHLGRNASADFHHVPAHQRSAVHRALSRMTVARLDAGTAHPVPSAHVALLDHLRLVGNSFEVSGGQARPPELELVYLAQSFTHLIGSQVDLFATALAGIDAGVPPADRLGTVHSVRHVVEAVFAGGDAHTAGVLTDHVRRSAARLVGQLISELVDPGGSATAGLARIDEWIRDEHDYWQTCHHGRTARRAG